MQEQDRKANSPFGDWDYASYETGPDRQDRKAGIGAYADSVQRVTLPELTAMCGEPQDQQSAILAFANGNIGDTWSQSDAEEIVGLWKSGKDQSDYLPSGSETTEDTDTDARCIFCGRVHGAASDADSDPEEAGAGDPVAARTLEDMLQQAFGAIFPGAGVTVTNADEPFFSKEDLLVLNASLQLMASTILSVEAMRDKRFDVAQGFANMSRKALDTAQSFVGSSTYALTTLGTMGERILDLAQEMNDGKTAGLVIAPF